MSEYFFYFEKGKKGINIKNIPKQEVFSFILILKNIF